MHSSLSPLTRLQKCFLLANQEATQLDFQNRPFSIKNLCLHGGKHNSKGKCWMKHLLSYLWQLLVAFHAAVLFRHAALGIITCRSPKACQRKKGKSCSLIHFVTDTPSHTQKIRFMFAAHGCFRLETYVHQQPFDWKMFAHPWFRWKKNDAHIQNCFLSICLMQKTFFNISQVLWDACPWSAESGDSCLDFLFFPWMLWITAATFCCNTMCCQCLLTGVPCWDIQFVSLW